MRVPRIGLLLCSLMICSESFAQHKILVITGGHDFERVPFYELFDSFSGIVYDTLTQPAGNELITTLAVDGYDALVFYDMYQDITELQKEAYIHLLAQGKGMVFLHHALVSYQDWPEFREIIGGKYLLKAEGEFPKSTYKHDVEIKVLLTEKDHPITNELSDFTIHDEVYGDFLVNEDVSGLLETNHPQSSKKIGWYHHYKNSRIVYIQLGHDHHAFENKNYRKIVGNSIHWVIDSK